MQKGKTVVLGVNSLIAQLCMKPFQEPKILHFLGVPREAQCPLQPCPGIVCGWESRVEVEFSIKDGTALQEADSSCSDRQPDLKGLA